MKQKTTKLIGPLFFILLIVFTHAYIDIFLNPVPVYPFQSTDDKFEYICYPSKGRDYLAMEKARHDYEKKNKVKLTLCRRFTMEPLHIWEWYKYLNSPYYRKYRFCRG